MKRELVERELTEEGPRRGSGVAKRKRSVTVNLAESPLGWLHSRGHLNDRQFDAGERLRMDFERAQLAPSVTMRWDPVRVDGGLGGADLTRLRLRKPAKRGKGAQLAGPLGQAGARHRARSGGGILPAVDGRTHQLPAPLPRGSLA